MPARRIAPALTRPRTMPTRRDVERTLRDASARQGGVATRAQLRGHGLLPGTIDRLRRSGRITVRHRAIYIISPLPRAEQHAALLAGGPHTRLSHGTAAALFRLGDLPSLPVEVTMRRGRTTRLKRVVIHHVRDLRADEATTVDGLRVTTIPRTLLDLAETSQPRVVEQAYALALRRRLVTPAAMRGILKRHPHHRGAPLWRTILSNGDPDLARSKAEEVLLEIVRSAQLPRPQLNVKLLGYEIDFLWRAQRLVAEVDGYVFHASSHSFAKDRRRATDLAANGFRVLQFTWSDLHDGRDRTIARLAQALAR